MIYEQKITFSKWLDSKSLLLDLGLFLPEGTQQPFELHLLLLHTRLVVRILELRADAALKANLVLGAWNIAAILF